MRVFAYADKDTFITNRVVSNEFRAEDGNLGNAGELTLLKLHNESTLPGTSSGIQEISRILISFDLAPLRELTASGQPLSGTRINNAVFRLRLFDAVHSDTVPSSFNILTFPLSRSFDEGIGIDTLAYQDIGSANFVSASGLASTAVTWSVTGAASLGYVGQANIDVMTGSTNFFGLGNKDLFVNQNFANGTEDLDINVTTVISAAIMNLIPWYGFRISFSGTEETDGQTRFRKSFYSRHANVGSDKQPRLEAIFNDTLLNNYSNFFFDTSGSIFIENVSRGKLTDIVSGSFTLTGQAADVTGPAHLRESLVVKIQSGTFTTFLTASHHKLGTYSASFALSSLETKLTGEINTAGSATFDTYWLSSNERIAYLTSSLIIKTIERTNFLKPKKYAINIINMKRDYQTDESAQFRLFIKPIVFSSNTSKLPSEIQSSIIHEMYYQLRDLKTGVIVIPFDKNQQSTRLSYDKFSNYFNFKISTLAPGRNYKLEFLIVEDDVEQFIDDNLVFRVIQ